MFHPDRLRGFSLIELLVTIVFVALIVCVAVPAVGSLQEDERAVDSLALIEDFRSAVRRHHQDTGRAARERSDRPREQFSAHQLTVSQAYSGWDGPYLASEVDRSSGVHGGAVLLFDQLSGGEIRPYGGGFRLDAGKRIHRGAGQFLALTKIPESEAKAIDAALDPDSGGDWKRQGSVQWRPERGGCLIVLLLDL